MKTVVVFLLLLCALNAGAVTRAWNNPLGGSWHDPANLSPSGVPGTTDTANINVAGTYTVIVTNTVNISDFTLGSASGVQSLIVDNNATLNVTNSAVVQATGIITVTNGGLQGRMSIQSGGQ